MNKEQFPDLVLVRKVHIAQNMSVLFIVAGLQIWCYLCVFGLGMWFGSEWLTSMTSFVDLFRLSLPFFNNS